MVHEGQIDHLAGKQQSWASHQGLSQSIATPEPQGFCKGFSITGQIVNILGFGDQSVTTTQLCYCNRKAALDNV